MNYMPIGGPRSDASLALIYEELKSNLREHGYLLMPKRQEIPIPEKEPWAKPGPEDALRQLMQQQNLAFFEIHTKEGLPIFKSDDFSQLAGFAKGLLMHAEAAK